VAGRIHEAAAELREELPEDLELVMLTDQSRYISDAVGQVWSAALIGGLLAIFVLYFFLRDLSSTVIIAVSIPVSVIATFLPMQQAGVTLNIMSLGGLALGVGMLVDNSIVVLEAIDRRRREGRRRPEAAVLGARDVAGAVTASTLTTVSVFVPIVFVQGIAGQLFYDQAVTVCFSLMASLLVALTLIPAAAALDPAAWRQGSFRTLFPWDQPATESSRWSVAPIRRAISGVWTFILRGLGARRGVGIALLNVLLLPARLLALVLILLLGLILLLALIADLLFPYLGTLRVRGLTMGPLGNGQHPFSRILSVYLYPVRLAVFLFIAIIGALWMLVSRLFHVIFWPLAGGFDLLGRVYPGGLRQALRLRWLVLVVAFGLFGLTIAALPLLGTNLVPDLAQGEFAFQLHLSEGTPLEVTADTVARIEDALLDEPGIERMFSLVGSLPSTASGRRTQGENLAQINFVLRDNEDRDAQSRAVSRVREVLALYPKVGAELIHPSVLTVKPPIAVQVFNEDLDLLDQAARQVEEALGGVPGVVDVTNSSEPGNPEVRVELDRERAAALGVTPELVGNVLRGKIRGNKIGEFREGEERLDIRLRVAEVSRDRAADVSALRVPLPGGHSVPVSAVARVEVGRGPAAIQRAGGARMAEISAKLTSTDLGGTLGRVRTTVAGLQLPAGAAAEMAGQDRELEVSFNSLKLMLALAVFLVYVVMAAQFESLLHPLVILISVPLGMVGVVVALMLTGNSISVLVLIGVVMLAGIVVNNAIVLVDAINRRRREGEELNQAIMGAGRERLRPILMTTTTTVLALLPMALGLGAGDELRAPLAVTVIGGLLGATVLTLVVIPCVYRIFSRPGTLAALVPRFSGEGDAATAGEGAS